MALLVAKRVKRTKKSSAVAGEFQESYAKGLSCAAKRGHVTTGYLGEGILEYRELSFNMF